MSGSFRLTPDQVEMLAVGGCVALLFVLICTVALLERRDWLKVRHFPEPPHILPHERTACINSGCDRAGPYGDDGQCRRCYLAEMSPF